MHSRDRRVGRAGGPVAAAGAYLPPIRDPRIGTRSPGFRVPPALAYRVAAVLAFATALGVVVPLARLAPDRARSGAVTAAPASLLGLPPGARAAVDQYVQSGKLTASGGASGQYVGEAVAVSADGSTLVVDGPNSGPGTAYVFVKPPTGWADATESGAVTVPNHSQTDVALSVSISASGDTIVFGEQGRAAYVFTRPAGGWSGHYSSTPDAKLTPSDSGAGFFGDAVGISGDTIVASARNGTVNGQFNRGALYVYAKPADGWHDATETARLTASDGAAGERLGLAVGIDGDTIAASAGHGNSGAVYVFVRPPSGWATGTQTAELTGPPDVSAYLGDTPNALAVSGGVVAAGARQYTSGTNTNQGAVFVYQRPASGWQDATETAMLTASDAAQYGYVGRAVAILGDTLVAGAENYEDGQQGAAYVYAAPAAGWQDATEDQKLVAADARDVDDFGIAVGIGSG
ncbi:MAG: hypothetical protein QOE28_2220, partial [Solirubrobacteraceae bacterium]|nr:hypothetical protein [Solirubrobacteraceae bacterium]